MLFNTGKNALSGIQKTGILWVVLGRERSAEEQKRAERL
jgi:hypothetical protein